MGRNVARQGRSPSLIRVRAAQALAALLPASFDAILLGLRSQKYEAWFRLICASWDVPHRVLVENELTPVEAAWNFAASSAESDVEVIAAEHLALVGRRAMRREFQARDLR